ncbi:MAG: zinc ABC transporter substrate-binding protein, partial [Candidatus Omnitrophica bacterium]|nr:zinc ABC transporter substrate-binding protein [Candidatus Omnitrophota bacterium]
MHKKIGIIMLTIMGILGLDSAAYAKKIQVVATIGMIADAAREIGGDKVEVKGLMGAGVDPHLYKATESDVNKLARADIIFYNGLHLEAKMEKIFVQMRRNATTVAV